MISTGCVINGKRCDINNFTPNIESVSGMMYTGNTLQKEDEVLKMSFAGIAFHPGKIIGFADSKLSFFNGTEYFEGNRNVQKVFSNEKYVITFVGSSVFNVRNPKSNVPTRLYLDNWVNQHIKSSVSPMQLTSELYRHLKQDSIEDIGTIIIKAGFIGNLFLEKEMILFNSKLERNSFSWSIQKTSPVSLFTSGNQEYVDYFIEHSNLLETEDEEMLKQGLLKKITEKDKEPGYNVVGGPICVRTLIPTECIQL